MRLIFADQYGINCVVAEPGDTAQQVIDRCQADDAVLTVDGIEFCVQVDDVDRQVGPELWSEGALRGSLPA